MQIISTFWSNPEGIGLLLNLVGTFILAIPNLVSTREFDDKRDRNIYFAKNGKHKFTTERMKFASRISKIAMGIIIAGFIFTLLGLISPQ
jgi:hypothetical protein